MLSKNKVKLIKSLEYKKFREKENLFLVEGEKLLQELLRSNFTIRAIYATEGWMHDNPETYNKLFPIIEQLTQQELEKASLLKTPQPVICLVDIPQKIFKIDNLQDKLSLVLDSVQDPGNLGTIIRVADWFGIENIICSTDCADVYNPKVIQSTMGAIFRVHVNYIELASFFQSCHSLNLPIYGTLLDGENIYKKNLTPHGVIVLGNESKGIHSKYHAFISNKLFIPFFPEGKKRSESLNVGTAAAITCAEFRRRVSENQ
jgi:RNA methyltransferase, TrmH family